MNDPIVSDVRSGISNDDYVVVTFTDTTEITFMPELHWLDMRRDDLQGLRVAHEGNEVARFSVRRSRRESSDDRPVFEHIEKPATPKLVGKYCLAALEHLACDAGDPMWHHFRTVRLGMRFYHDMLRI